jgi:hypothetical protein
MPGATSARQLRTSQYAYKDFWFYIDETDQDTKSTFSLLMELARLELAGRSAS